MVPSETRKSRSLVKRAAFVLATTAALVAVMATSGAAAPGPPTVVEVSPQNLDMVVRPDITVTATFSEEMQRASINADTFLLSKGNPGDYRTPIPATVTYNPVTKKATLDPNSPLTPGNYYASVRQGARDLEGVRLDQSAAPGDQPKTWSFKVHDTPVDPSPLKVTSWSPLSPNKPAPAATNVTATFSEKVKSETVNSNTFKLARMNQDGTATPVGAAVSYNAATRTARLNPTADLEPEATYQATVTVGVRDLSDFQLDQDPTLAGNQGKTWRFKAADIPMPTDTTPPTVIATTPVPPRPSIDPEVPGTVNLTGTFSEDMQPESINSSTVTLTRNGVDPITSEVTYDAPSRTVTIDPAADLTPGRYWARVGIGARDLAGNQLDQNPTRDGNQSKVWMISVVNTAP